MYKIPSVCFVQHGGVASVDLNKKFLRTLKKNFIHIEPNKTTLFREQQALFGKFLIIRDTIHDQLICVGELYNRVNHPRHTILLCRRLHKDP